MNPEDIPELVRVRVEQARECLADAKVLLDAGRSGRSVVNRSYYSMFYCVLALLQTINRVPRKHQGAIAIFDQAFIHRGIFPREMSTDLHEAFTARQVDDYQRLDPVSTDEAREIMNAAERFLASVTDYLKRAGLLQETPSGETPEMQ